MLILVLDERERERASIKATKNICSKFDMLAMAILDLIIKYRRYILVPEF